MVADVPHADTIFNLIFFIVLVSVLIQGSSLNLMAKLLRLIDNKEDLINEKSDTEELEYFEDQMLKLKITEYSSLAGKKISEVGFPEGTLITLINREGDYIHPNGKTEIYSDDKLLIMCKDKIKFFKYIEQLH